MQKDIQNLTLSSSPKTERGLSSSLDVSVDYILYFNQQTLFLVPRHQQEKPVLSLLHISEVVAAKFSPDGRHVASIDARGTLFVCQICPNKLLIVHQYEGFYPNGKCLDWTADKKRICVVGTNKGKFGRVGLVDTGTNAGQITGVAGYLATCSFRPQRPYKLVAGGEEMVLKFFDGPPYNFVKSDKSNSGYINHVKYSPKGSLILIGGADRKLSLYEGTKFQKVSEKENAHNGGIFGIDWIDQEHFVTCSSDKLIKIWNTKFQEKFIIETGTPEELKNPKAIWLFLVAVRIFGQHIYAINLEGNILVYKNPLLTGENTLVKTHYGYRNKVSKLIAVENSHLIILDSGGCILSYSLSQNKMLPIKSALDIKHISDGFYSQNQQSKSLYVLLQDGAIAIFQTSSSCENLKLKKKLQKMQFKYISPLESTKIIGVSNNNLCIYDSDKEIVIKQLNLQEEITFVQSNQNYVLSGTLKGNVFIYDSNLQEVAKINLASFKISSVSIIQLQGGENGFIIGDAMGNMKLFKIKFGSNQIQMLKGTMGGHNSLITGATFDNKWIYTFGMDGKINIWNKQSLSRVSERVDVVKGGILGCICISDRLIVAGDDLTIKIIATEK